MPPQEVSDWYADSTWVTEAEQKAEKEKNQWFESLTAMMTAKDPFWEWTRGTSAHPTSEHLVRQSAAML